MDPRIREPTRTQPMHLPRRGGVSRTDHPRESWHTRHERSFATKRRQARRMEAGRCRKGRLPRLQRRPVSASASVRSPEWWAARPPACRFGDGQLPLPQRRVPGGSALGGAMRASASHVAMRRSVHRPGVARSFDWRSRDRGSRAHAGDSDDEARSASRANVAAPPADYRD